jgi:hypothetical protein
MTKDGIVLTNNICAAYKIYNAAEIAWDTARVGIYWDSYAWRAFNAWNTALDDLNKAIDAYEELGRVE